MKRLFYSAAAVVCLAVAPVVAGEGHLHGTVVERVGDSTRALKSAIIQWVGKPTKGTLSDARGVFELERDGIVDERIVVRYAGYVPDTVDVEGLATVDVVLDTPIELEGVVVEGSRSTAAEVHNAPVRTEIITDVEIEKDACCDLTGCFNTSSAVEPNVTDFVTDRRELQILGMSGVYNQVLVDGMPMLMTGLNSGYGLNLIPGPFIKRISVVKGANSVLQGDESITGLVDVRLKDPEDIDGAFANLFVNAHMEKQLNAAYAGNLSDSWGAMIAGHVTAPAQRVDAGGDAFLDMPLVTRYSAFGKLKYEEQPGGQQGVTTVLFAKYTDEERVGGHRNFEVDRDLGQSTWYGQTVDTRRFEGYGRFVLITPDADDAMLGTKLSLSLAGSLHRQDAFFGLTGYRGDQYTLYADMRGERVLSPTFTARGGIDYRMESIDETIDLGSNPLGKSYGGVYAFDESSVGVYSEVAWDLIDETLTVMPGARVDFFTNSGADGDDASFEPQPSVRMFVIARPDELTTLRASAGYGTRWVRFWSENSTALAAGRDIRRAPVSPEYERGINIGGSISRIVEFSGIPLTIAADYYRTILQEQVYIDYEADATAGFLRTDNAHSHSAQLEVAADISSEWQTKVAYTFLEAMRTENDVEQLVPFSSKHRILATASFMPEGTPWQFDANLHWYGKQRIPSTDLLPEHLRRAEYSDPYTLLNVQGTYRWETLDLYAGVENVLNFRQNDPIIDPSRPFGQYFDTSFIWGPVKGREFYAGVRYTLQAL